MIQRRWRMRCILRRREGLPGLIEKTNRKSSLHKVEDTCIERPERERAAVVIQVRLVFLTTLHKTIPVLIKDCLIYSIISLEMYFPYLLL